MDIHTNTLLLEWQAPIRISHERSKRWYMIAGALATCMIVYGLLTGAWTTSLVTALAAGLYYLVRNEKQPILNIRIFDTGIEVNGNLETWKSWKDFWILVGPGYAELHVDRKGFKPELVVLTGNTDPTVIRDTLNQFLPHSDERREKILDTFIRFCKI